MGKEDNLIRFDQMSKEEHLAKSAKGGRESARTRQVYTTFKKAMKEALKKINTNAKGDEIDGRGAIVNALIREAVKGNVRAAELTLKLVGENPVEKIEISGKRGKDLFKTMSDEELRDKVDSMVEMLKKSE